jgi:hypothetical protein
MRIGSAKSTARQADDNPPMITFSLAQACREEKDLDHFSGVNYPSPTPVSLAERPS